MTTKELITALQKADPEGTQTVTLFVGSYTNIRRHDLNPDWVEKPPFGGVRIYSSFPEGFSVSERKKR